MLVLRHEGCAWQRGPASWSSSPGYRSSHHCNQHGLHPENSTSYGEHYYFFSIGKGGLINFTAYAPNATNKPATDFVKLNEAFLSSKQSFDFPKSCPSPQFLGPLSTSHCLWMGIRNFLRLLPWVPLGYSNQLNQDKTVKANFAILIFPETTEKSFINL